MAAIADDNVPGTTDRTPLAGVLPLGEVGICTIDRGYTTGAGYNSNPSGGHVCMIGNVCISRMNTDRQTVLIA